MGEMFLSDQLENSKRQGSVGTHPFILGLAPEPGITKVIDRVGYMVDILACVLKMYQGNQDVTVGAETCVSFCFVRLEGFSIVEACK